MMKKFYFAICSLLLFISKADAQHFALFNTRTLFDAYENPAVKAFKLDSSGKYASNFFLPTFSINSANKGSSSDVIRQITYERVFNTRNLPIGTGAINEAFENTNIYLLTFRIFSSYKYNQEVGFAWQVRSDANASYTNESLAIFDSYRRFTAQQPYNNIFNTESYQQSYHQFSVSIRENWNKKLALGVKLSLLSGIAYNSLTINKSYLYADAINDRLDIGVNGTYKGSFLRTDELGKRTLIPTFKNPGLSMSIGTTYASKSGYFLMGNIKDLGFISWSKSSHIVKLNTLESITDISSKSTNEINKKITDLAYNADENKAFVTPTNAKVDFLLSRTFGIYKPSFIISKNLFYAGGDIAFVNTFNIDKFAASITPIYNFNDLVMFGIQGMYKTPNFEFFLGTDNIGKSISLARGIKQSDASVGNGYNAGSFYMGLGIKFGRTVNHPMNMSTMPGVNGEKVYKGFFRSLFEFFKK